jgi:BNR repeat-like domain
MPTAAPAGGHREVHREPHAYCSHPHAVALPDGEWLVVFNRTYRRPFILHPPQDPYFHNLIIRSSDQGQTWSAPVMVPGHGWHGVECAGLTALPGGRVLLHQWRFQWLSLPDARRRGDATPLALPGEMARGLELSPELDGLGPADPERLMPWARGPGRAYVHVSDDRGETWSRTVELDTGPFVGGYNMRGAVRLPDGQIVLPLCDVPSYERVFVMHSGDGGFSWSHPVRAASEPGLLFEEPCPLAFGDGRLLLLLRENRTRSLYQVTSADGGYSWSRPAPTGIEGYPAHLVALADGRIVCTYGHRSPDYSIRAVVSTNGGHTWARRHPIIVRAALPNRDLGYPCTVITANDRLSTFYYCQDLNGVTGIEMNIYDVD